ncbi:MAG: hypothetical protein WC829_05795 [Hyphomicrobium sp.]|jgi:hypothetical protein
MLLGDVSALEASKIRVERIIKSDAQLGAYLIVLLNALAPMEEEYPKEKITKQPNDLDFQIMMDNIMTGLRREAERQRQFVTKREKPLSQLPRDGKS